MEYSRILRRAWEVTWRYKALWVFGILVALFSGGAGGGGSPGRGPNVQLGGLREPPLGDFIWPFDLARVIAAALVIALAVMFVLLFLALIGAVLRYLSTVALVRMVDEYDETGQRRSVGEGFRLGWSVRALRVFAIDLVIGIPVAVLFLVLVFLALSPLLLWATGSEEAGIFGTIVTLGLVLVLVLFGVLVAVALSLLKPFFYRKAILQDVGVFVAIGEGYHMVRRHFRHASTMWLIVIGIAIAYSLALVPVAIALVLLAMLVGGGSGLVLGWLVSLFLGGAAPWLAGAVAGLPICRVLTVVPLTAASGLFEVFRSAVWTLTYRELLALEARGG